MSAQQPLCSSRGHRSTTTGRSAGSGPRPGSCPPPDRADTTMMSVGAGAPAAAHADRMADRTASAVNGSPSLTSRPPAVSAPRISVSAAVIPASAARWARRMPSSSPRVLTRRRASTAAESTSIRTSAARSRSATATGRSPGNDGLLDPPPGERAHHGLPVGLIEGHAAFHELVEAQLVHQEQLGAGEDLRDALGLEGAGQHQHLLLPGHEQQRVDDLER